jgi:hypothetical protein
MKKLIAIATILAAGAVANAQSASSVNAAGFVKKTIDSGELQLISPPFEAFSGVNPTANDLFGSSLPAGTTIYYFNVATQQYLSETYNTDPFNPSAPGTWSPGVKQFARGEGFFLSIPSSAPYDVFLFGEVPDSRTAPTTTTPIAAGLQLLGFTYPVAVSISNPDLGLSPSAGDTIYVWNNGWTSITFNTDPFNPSAPGSWSDPNFVLQPGQAIFYRALAGNSWLVDKSDFYTWP